MLITVDKAVEGLVKFMSQEAMKIPNIPARFLMYGALGTIKQNPHILIDSNLSTLKMIGAITQDDMVDTDIVRTFLESAFKEVPKFTALNFTFDNTDAANLLRLMEA